MSEKITHLNQFKAEREKGEIQRFKSAIESLLQHSIFGGDLTFDWEVDDDEIESLILHITLPSDHSKVLNTELLREIASFLRDYVMNDDSFSYTEPTPLAHNSKDRIEILFVKSK